MRVIISDPAIGDLDDIWMAVAEFASPAAADRLLDLLRARCDELGRFPDRFSIVPGLEDVGVRRTHVREWAVFYVVVDDRFVEVLRIVGGRRRVPTNLF